MAVVTGTVVAASSASTTTGASVTAGGTAVSAAATAKQADAIRRLASAFIKSAGMKAVGDSEIVDEFASPIYAGLSAVPTGPTPPNPGTPVAKTSGSMQDLVGVPALPGTTKTTAVDDSSTRFLVGTNDEPKIEVKELQKGLQSSEDQMVSPNTANRTVLPVEKPVIKELIDRYYDAPTIKDQLETGNDKIVVERNVLVEEVNGNERTANCIIEERIVDRRYLEHGNLTDLISEVRHGHVPTIRQLYLAIIDLTDLATFKVFRPLLARVKFEPATYRLRQLTADFETKVLDPSLDREEKSLIKLDRKIEERSWFKPDHVVEKIRHEDKVSKKQLEIAVVNVTDVCTVELNKGAVDGFISRRSEMTDLSADTNAIARIERTLPPEAIESINKSAMAWVRENLCSTTSEYTTVETFNRYKADLDGFLGKKVEMSDKLVTERVKTTFSEYLSTSDRICLESIDTYQQALEKFASLQKTMSSEFDPQIVNTYVEPGDGVRFEEGWITYIPGGSIANLGVKVDLDCKITGMDVFWAAVDVATIALAIATWGTSTAVTSAGMAAGKAVVKGGVKAVAKSGARIATKAGTKTVAKQTGRVALRNASKAGTKAIKIPGGKASVAKTTNAAVKNTTKGSVASTAKAGTVSNAKTAVVKEAQAGAENSVKQSGKVKINNSGKAGTKAKPSVEVSQPDVTYKNIPKTGKYDGVPGDSMYHPDPKATPSNPKANPYGKTNAQILRENNMREGIPFEKGYPNFSNASKATVNIENMSVNRSANMGRADSLLAQQVREGKAGSTIESNLKKMGVDPKNVTKGDVSRMRKEYGLTWHEHQNKQTMQLIQKELHGTIPHKGGISALKQEANIAAKETMSTTVDAARSTLGKPVEGGVTASSASATRTVGAATPATTTNS